MFIGTWPLLKYELHFEITKFIVSLLMFLLLSTKLKIKIGHHFFDDQIFLEF